MDGKLAELIETLDLFTVEELDQAIAEADRQGIALRQLREIVSARSVAEPDKPKRGPRAKPEKTARRERLPKTPPKQSRQSRKSKPTGAWGSEQPSPTPDSRPLTPVQSSPAAEAAADAVGSDRLRIYLEMSGPTKVKVIAEQLGLSYQTVYSCLNSRKDLFKKTAEGTFGLVTR